MMPHSQGWSKTHAQFPLSMYAWTPQWKIICANSCRVGAALQTADISGSDLFRTPFIVARASPACAGIEITTDYLCWLFYLNDLLAVPAKQAVLRGFLRVLRARRLTIHHPSRPHGHFARHS